jgi:hypothetical protein
LFCICSLYLVDDPRPGGPVTMLLYVQAWLPLVAITLTAAISFAVASLVMGRP